MGQSHFEAVREMEDTPDFYKYALGVAYPPFEETLRQRLDDIGSPLRQQILPENVSMLRDNSICPKTMKNNYIPVDMDVSPFDNSKTHKEEVSRTYKGCDGYAPMFAYIGAEGYLVNDELCERKQHCQCGTPKFLTEPIGLCRQITDGKLLFRLDSGNDASDNIGILLEKGGCFNIKHNLRRE